MPILTMLSILKKFPLRKEHSIIVILIILLSMMAFIFNNSLSDFLVYQQDLIVQGQVWRLLTGHFFHTNHYHLLLNLAAVVMLWALHGHFYYVKNTSLLFITSGLTCSLGLYFFSPSIIQYVGLSGVLHGFFIWGALMDIKNKDKTGYWLVLGVCLKIAHEQFYGASTDISALINARVAIDAHLWGAVGGLLFFIMAAILSVFSVNKKAAKA